MEIQHFLVVIYLIVGISSVVISCSTQASFLGKIVSHSSDSQTDGLYSEASHWLHEYIAESYFRMHDILLDSHFHNFIVHESAHRACDVLQNKLKLGPKVSVLDRHLIGEGSHRQLLSSIKFENELESISEPPAHFCKVIIIEKLPSGVFADPFELERLVQHNAFDDASVFGDSNLELPSFQSNRSVVEVHKNVGANVFFKNKHKLEVNIDLPLHARYPPLSEQGFSSVEFGKPDMFFRCSFEVDSHNQTCLFQLTNNTAQSQDVCTVWEVPCGNKEHTWIVSVVTFVTAIISALLIVWASMCFTDTLGWNGLKES